MAQIVDELLVKLGVDPTKWKTGLAEATKAGKSFVAGPKPHQTALAGVNRASGLTRAGQVACVKKVTDEYAAQDDSVNKLETLLKAEQRTRSDSVKVLTAQADALQRITPFADDQIISM